MKGGWKLCWGLVSQKWELLSPKTLNQNELKLSSFRLNKLESEVPNCSNTKDRFRGPKCLTFSTENGTIRLKKGHSKPGNSPGIAFHFSLGIVQKSILGHFYHRGTWLFGWSPGHYNVLCVLDHVLFWRQERQSFINLRIALRSPAQASECKLNQAKNVGHR